MTGKTFTFYAQQGQQDEICRLLMAHGLGKPKVRRKEKGCFIEVKLPKGVSKRTVDKMLWANRVPGSVARLNRYPVVSGNSAFDVKYNDKVQTGEPFYWVSGGKFQGLYKLEYFSYGCTCCGGYEKLVPAKK